MAELIQIGQFSELTSTSKRMLRHYDKMGILKPIETDVFNGYRYYSSEQQAIISTVKALQGHGFSLNEIKSLMNNPIDLKDFLGLLKDKEAILRNRIDSDVSELVRIRRSIETIQSDSSGFGTVMLEHLKLERSHLLMTRTNDAQDILHCKEKLYALPSYSMFIEYMEDFVKKNTNSTLTFITLDIDNFAPINDHYGFDVGDKVIYRYFDQIVRHFNNYIDQGHGIMSRMGGDEIGIFLHDLEVDELIKSSEEALDSIRKWDFNAEGYDKQVTATCGLYSTDSIVNVAELRHNSTKAMLDAKRNGRDRLSVYMK